MAGAQRALTCGSLVPDSRNPKSFFFVELACSVELKAATENVLWPLFHLSTLPSDFFQAFKIQLKF